MKKILAILLSSVLVVSMFAVFAISAAAETIDVDGNLTDDGWAAEGWTSVTPENGYWQAVPTTSDTLSFKYQLRTDDTKLYGAIVADCALVEGGNGTGTNARIWFRTDDSYLAYNYFYGVNTSGGETKYNTVKDGNVSANIESSTFKYSIKEVDGKTQIEFSVDLAEFGGADGFDYFISLSNKVTENIALFYPAVTVATPRDTNLPYRAWEAGKALTVDPAEIALEESSEGESSSDASSDASSETSSDASSEVSSEVSSDASSDVSSDASSDASSDESKPGAVKRENIALNKTYTGGDTAITNANGTTAAHSAKLTDGKAINVIDYNGGWLGLWYNKDATIASNNAPDGVATIVVDLEKVYEGINDVRLNLWLGDPASGIGAPKSIKVSFSEDGETYGDAVDVAIPEGDSAWATADIDNASAQYVKFVIETQFTWTFLNEIEVYVGEEDAGDSDDASTSSTPSTPVKPGDASNMIIFVIVAIVAMAGSAVVIKTRR